MNVFGETAIRRFTQKHVASRKSLQRFLAIVHAAKWPHVPAVKQAFAATDYPARTGTLIFDIGGNKYRLIARVDFENQLFFIESVLSHQEYNREKL